MCVFFGVSAHACESVRAGVSSVSPCTGVKPRLGARARASVTCL